MQIYGGGKIKLIRDHKLWSLLRQITNDKNNPFDALKKQYKLNCSITRCYQKKSQFTQHNQINEKSYNFSHKIDFSSIYHLTVSQFFYTLVFCELQKNLVHINEEMKYYTSFS